MFESVERFFAWLFGSKSESEGGGDVGPVDGSPFAGWETWPGARPEVRGKPTNTILAVPGLDAWTPDDRAAILSAAEALNCPVDSLASVWSSESGLRPWAAYGLRFRASDRKPMRAASPAPNDPYLGYMLDAENEKRVAAGKQPFFAVGILQLTLGAHLEGFSDNATLLSVLEWSPKQQIERIAVPLYSKMRVSGAHPGMLYMKNFLPDEAGKPPSAELARDPSPRYTMNKGFDTQQKGYILVQDVWNSVGRTVRKASFRRMTVDGRTVGPEGPATSSAPSAAPATSSAPSAAPATSSAPSAAPMPNGAGHRLIAAVKAGAVEVPDFFEVPFMDEIVLVSKDALRAKVNGVSLRLPVTWPETIEICRSLDLVPAVAALEDAAWKAAEIHVSPQPLGEWDTPEQQKASSEGMITLEWCQRFNRELDAAIASEVKTAKAQGQAVSDSPSVAPVGKSWIFSNRLADWPDRAITYGWHYKTGVPIQRAAVPGSAEEKKKPFHDNKHFDYSQTFRAYKRRTKSGKDLLDVYRAQGLKEEVIRLFTQ